MIIITEETEKKLLQALDTNELENNDRRCLYIKSSELKEFDFDKTITFINDNIDDQRATIFICDDGDIFIIARDVGAAFSKMLERFISPTTLTQPARSFGFVDLFEIRVDRYKILNMVEEKLIIKDKIQARQCQEQVELKAQENRQEILDMPAPEKLIKTLAKRRDDRLDTEILIVEDDLFSQVLVKKSLTGTGNISIAKDGRSAIAQYLNKAPDILFLDIGLPDINGHDVLEKILKYDPQAFVIMLSGKGDKDNIMKAMKSGAKGFVGKPFTRDKLFQYIEKSPHINQSNA